mgnify:CR=1 FL=1
MIWVERTPAIVLNGDLGLTLSRGQLGPTSDLKIKLEIVTGYPDITVYISVDGRYYLSGDQHRSRLPDGNFRVTLFTASKTPPLRVAAGIWSLDRVTLQTNTLPPTGIFIHSARLEVTYQVVSLCNCTMSIISTRGCQCGGA